MKSIAALLIIIAIVIGVTAVGYIVFSQFLNHPQYKDGKLCDQLGREVSPAPWFVRTFLRFLTDSVSEPIESEVVETVIYPMAPGRYWLGLRWSLIDWLGVITLLCVAYGLGVAGVSLWD